MKMCEDFIQYTAFSLSGEHFKYLRMPFGLNNAPKTFQMTMSRIFGEFDYVKIYLDNLLIHSKIYNEHRKNIENVLDLWYKLNISINHEKSTFAGEEIKYLGIIINKHGIKPDSDKISSFKNITIKNKKNTYKNYSDS